MWSGKHVLFVLILNVVLENCCMNADAVIHGCTLLLVDQLLRPVLMRSLHALTAVAFNSISSATAYLSVLMLQTNIHAVRFAD